MSDTNNQTIKYSVDASGVEAGVSKLVSQTTRVNQAMAESADRAAKLNKAEQALAEQGLSATTRQLNAVIGQMDRMRDAMSKTQVERFSDKLDKLGLGNAFSGEIAELKELEKAAKGAHGGMAGISRELMVMSHEALTGNFKRLGGSAMVLGERLNVLQYALSPIGAAVAATAAGATALGVVMYEGEKEARQFAAALQMTGNYAGLTADSFTAMAGRVAVATGSGLGTAAELLRNLAASGQYTSDQMQGLATVMLDTSRVTGQSLEDVSKLYEGLSKDPAKWAQEHIGSMHMMNAATLEHVEALQRDGDTYAAFQTVVDSLLQQVQDSSQQYLSAARSEWDKLTSSIENAWAAMKRGASGNETITDQINDLKRLRDQVAASPDAVKGYDDEIAALQRQRRQLQQNADQLSAYQQVQERAATAEGQVEKMRDQFATNAEKRAKELDALRKDRDSIVAAGGSMPDYDKLVAGIEEKYKDRGPRGSSPVAAINADTQSALEMRRLIEQQEQQKLQFQRQMGLVSERQYYAQLHQIQVDALNQEIADAQKRADLLKGSKDAAAYKRAQGSLALLQQQRAGLDQTYSQQTGTLDFNENLANSRESAGNAFQLRQLRSSMQSADDTRDMSPLAKQQYDELYQIREQYAQKVEQLYEQYGLDPASDQKEYADKLKNAQQYYDQLTQIKQQAIDADNARATSYSDQMHLAMASLSGDGQTAAQTTAEAFTQAWSDSTNALNTFLTTGKGNFDQFVAGVLADMAKIVLQWSEMQAMQGLMSALGLGSLGALGGSGAGASVGVDSAVDSGTAFAATGGHITGPGSGTSDSIPAMLSNGEYVINAAATKKYRGLLDSINSGRLSKFANGGAVGSVQSSGGTGDGGSNPVSVVVNHNGGGGLSDQDAKDLHKLVQAFVDQRMSYQMRRQGGYAQQIRYGQI